MRRLPILYVEDDDDSCDLMEIMLRQADDAYSLTSVDSAQRALVLMENLSFRLYIIDYLLSDALGTDLCRQIRLTDSQTPIIFYSGMAREVDKQAALAAGANEYLIKPKDLDKVVETIARLINQKSSSLEEYPSSAAELF